MTGALGEDRELVSAVELRARIEKRELSARAINEDALARIEQLNPHLNAVVSLRAEAALAEATALDGNERRGVLHGLPVTIKDLSETVDLPTTYGSRALAGRQGGFDAVAVRRLREAGAVVIGKTNTSEFGLRPTTENSLFGATSNPWKAGYNSGGSSGGAAAGVAAGMSPLALGSDGGGSCRIPSSCCGVVGMKPTRGRVPLAPGHYEAWGGLVTEGPIARTVGDVALMLDVISGPVVGEPYGVAAPERSFAEASRQRPGRLRIGYVADPPDGAALDPEIRSTFEESLRTIESLRHEVVEVDPGLDGLRDAYMTIKCGNTAATVALLPDEALADLESNTLAIAKRGFAATAADYCAALDLLRAKAARIMLRCTEIDFLATPTLTKLPLPNGLVPSIADFDERWRFCLDWHCFTFPFNITGQPAISIPAGWSAKGLPIGLQLVGRTGDDAGVLALAASLEEARPWSGRRPELDLGTTA